MRAEIADTNWYRPEFDQFLVKEAEAVGALTLDRTGLQLLHAEQ